MTFAALFQHIDDCPRCNHVTLDLCDEGKRLRDAAGDRATKLTSAGAPVPTSLPGPGEKAS